MSKHRFLEKIPPNVQHITFILIFLHCFALVPVVTGCNNKTYITGKEADDIINEHAERAFNKIDLSEEYQETKTSELGPDFNCVFEFGHEDRYIGIFHFKKFEKIIVDVEKVEKGVELWIYRRPMTGIRAEPENLVKQTCKCKNEPVKNFGLRNLRYYVAINYQWNPNETNSRDSLVETKNETTHFYNQPEGLGLCGGAFEGLCPCSR